MKKQNVFQTMLASFMAVVAMIMTSTAAIAHPGHNHAANESMLMHVLFYGAIAAVVAAATWVVYRQLNKQNGK